MKEQLWFLALVFMRVVAPQAFINDIKEFKYNCAENVFNISITTKYPFSGRIYPVNMHNTPCAKYYHQAGTTVVFELTLVGCNTLSYRNENNVQYSNEIYIQMHESLITVNDESHKVSCVYNGTDQESLISNAIITHPAEPIALPFTNEVSCSIEIFRGANTFGGEEAEIVKLGEKLTLLVRCDDLSDETLGMRVTDCVVTDGVNLGEQKLYDEDGCAVDEELIGDLYYNQRLTRAYVGFKAHKFPYSPSVYYKCNIHICNKNDENCLYVPPKCVHKRQSREVNNRTNSSPGFQSNTTVQVTKSLGVDDSDSHPQPSVSRKDDEICLDKLGFIIGISITAFLLLLAIIILIAILLWRRRRRVDKDGMSDTMSGYTNNGYAGSRAYST